MQRKTPRAVAIGVALLAAMAVTASADSKDYEFQLVDKEGAQGQRKIIHYRNPMGLPDISPVPKKDSMGMDYIPVYEGEAEDGNTVKVSPGKIQRTGVQTEPVGKRAISRTIHAPGIVAIDERRVTVVAPALRRLHRQGRPGHQRHSRQEGRRR